MPIPAGPLSLARPVLATICKSEVVGLISGEFRMSRSRSRRMLSSFCGSMWARMFLVWA